MLETDRSVSVAGGRDDEHGENLCNNVAHGTSGGLEWSEDPANGGALRQQLFANGRTGSPVGEPL